jgi:ferrochelatase
MSKRGVLLVNLGSPDSPAVRDVRRFLRQFLMDGRVLDVPWPVRFFTVNCFILPFRAKKSAEAYRKIWTPQGSPLVATGKRVCAELQPRLGMPVELAMRYRNPSIESAVDKLRAAGVDNLLLIPLFPQFATSSFETVVARVNKVVARRAPGMLVQMHPPFFADDDYIVALVASAQDCLQRGYDHLLVSFHGVPERHLRKADWTKSHCLTVKDCCNVPSPAHATCYRHQCLKTVEAFAMKAGIAADRYSVAFQSRLGRDRWLQPYTDAELKRLAAGGVKRLLVICPSFVADCLETLEEIGMRGRETFLAAGGGEFTLIPCLNDHPLWLAALSGIVTRAFAN